MIEPRDNVKKIIISENPKIQAAFEEVMEKYESAFRELAKT